MAKYSPGGISGSLGYSFKATLGAATENRRLPNIVLQ